MLLLKKFRKSQIKSSKKSRKISLHRKEFQREGVVGVVLMREEKAFSGEKKEFLQVAHKCAALRVFWF